MYWHKSNGTEPEILFLIFQFRLRTAATCRIVDWLWTDIKCIVWYVFNHWHWLHSMWSDVYETVELRRATLISWCGIYVITLFVSLSICLSHHWPPSQCVVGLLLHAVRAGDIDPRRRPPGAQQQRRHSTGPQHGTQQQIRVVSRWQLM